MLFREVVNVSPPPPGVSFSNGDLEKDWLRVVSFPGTVNPGSSNLEGWVWSVDYWNKKGINIKPTNNIHLFKNAKKVIDDAWVWTPF